MKYVINQSNEFIDNYKILQLASAEKKMEALCNENYNRLFSIGDDKKFYLTYEKADNDTGWEKINLLASIEKSNPNKNIEAKTFAIAQDVKDEKFYLAVVVSIDNEDSLFLSKEEIVDVPKWINIPFDDDSIKGGISIKEIYMSTLNSKRYIIADIDSENTSKIIKRYFIDIDSNNNSNKWKQHPLPADFKDIYTTIMGRSYKEAVDGVYTIGSIEGVRQLIYTPSYNYFNPKIAPSPIRFYSEKNVEFISTLREKSTGYTHLITCGEGSLYIYPYKEQKDNAKPYKILDDENLYNIKNIYSYEVNGKKIVWILNKNGDLFYCFTSSDYSNITNSSCWSTLVPVAKNIQYAYAYPNLSLGTSNYFSYGYDSIINIGKESSETSLWTTQKVNLTSLNGPSTKFPSYCTRIEITDDKKTPMPNKKVLLKATDNCNVYINNKYYSFAEDPISVITDERGLIKIVQQADSTVSANFNVVVNDRDSNSVSMDISPQNKQLEKLTSLNTVDKLKNAKTTTGENLVPSGIKDEDIEAVANSMDVFKDMASSLPEDGTVMKEGLLKAVNYASTSHKGLLVLKVNGDSVTSYVGEDAARNLSPRYLQFKTNRKGFVDDVVYTCGEVLSFVKNIASKVFDIIIDFANDVWNFVLTIGDKIYSFVVKCINEVVACVEAVYNLIKVTIEKIFEFIKFLFSWKDISRVQDVTKKSIFLFADYLKENVKELGCDVNNVLETLIKKACEIGDLEGSDEIVNKSITDLENSYTPEENTNVTDMYLCDYFVENYANATGEVNLKSKLSSDNNVKDAFEVLVDAALKEKDIIKDLVIDLQDNLFTDSKFLEYDLLTLMKKIMAIIAKSALSTCGNVLTAAIDLFEVILDSALEILDKPIKIPVLSDILTDIFGIKPFSLLDITCLIPAIASTAIYKLTTGEAPLTDEMYNYYMSINSFKEINKVNMLLTAAQADNPSKIEKVFYCLFHISAGVIGLLEGVFQLVGKVTKLEDNSVVCFGLTTMFDFLDICIMGSSYAIYSPIENDNGIDKAIFIISILLVVVKALVDCADIVLSHKKLKDKKTAKLVFNIIKAIDSAIELACQVGMVIYYSVVKAKKYITGESAALVICDNISVIVSDLKDFCDVALDYIEDPVTKGITEAARLVCSAGYSVTQIAIGITGIFVLDLMMKSGIYIK